MGWFKVDDQLSFHAKTIMSGNAAMGLWVRCGAWASAHLTDGFIPAHMANAMANDGTRDGKNDLPSRLVESGLWDEVDGGYQFHDWDLFQPDSKAEKERREKLSRSRSEAGRKGAEARWGNAGPDNNRGKPDGKAVANAWQDDGTAMAPSRPVPSSIEGRPKNTRRRLSDDFTPTDAHASKAKELGVDLDTELERFKNHFIGNGDTKADWGRTFSNWISRANQFNGGNRPQPPQPSFDPWAGDWSEDEIRRST